MCFGIGYRKGVLNQSNAPAHIFSPFPLYLTGFLHLIPPLFLSTVSLKVCCIIFPHHLDIALTVSFFISAFLVLEDIRSEEETLINKWSADLRPLKRDSKQMDTHIQPCLVILPNILPHIMQPIGK